MQIQTFINEFKLTFVYDLLRQTLTDEQLFEHSVQDGQVTWFKEQMRQMWHLWTTAAAEEVPDGFALVKVAKAQAVPVWKDYTVESPRIDGPYQIFIMSQQLVAKWESPWGFSSIEDGDALNQELITHWSVLGNDPAIEPQEPAND